MNSIFNTPIRLPHQKPRIIRTEDVIEADRRTQEAIEAEHVRQRDEVLRGLEKKR